MAKRVVELFVLFLLITVPSYCINVNLGLLQDKDYWPTDEWLTASPEELGVNSEILNQMDSYIKSNLSGLDSILIVKNGYIIKEKYSINWDKNKAHEIYSCTKSFTSALTGISIDLGYLNLNDSVLEIFPDKKFSDIDEEKEKITIENLLSMQSGISWDEWSVTYENPENPLRKMIESNDWVQFVLNKTMEAEPGTLWVYNTGTSHVLSAIIQKVTGISTLSFAKENLFSPLGITPRYWMESPNGVVCGGTFLQLTPRDMAKFGYLYLNNGTWDGKQIISQKWINQSVKNYIEIEIESKKYYYGYQWWIEPEKYGYFTYRASGYMGQWIKCIPALDLVVVCTGSTRSPNWIPLLTEYIIPAIENNGTSSEQKKNPFFTYGFPFLLVFFDLIILYIIFNRNKFSKS